MNLIAAAMESIDFQSHEFGEAITALFQEMLDAKLDNKGAQKHSARKQIEVLTFKTTGVLASLTLDTNEPPCTRPPALNLNSVVFQEWIRGFVRDDHQAIMRRLEREKKSGAGVNLKTGRVSGIYSELEAPIWMSWDFMKRLKFTAGEMAAIYLHETGHNFVNFELLSRAVTGNQILAAAARALDGSDHSQYVQVIKKAGELQHNDPNYFAELTEVKDKRVITTIILTDSFQTNHSVSGSKNYDNVSFEALSDNFVARQGLGRDLVTGLERLSKAYGYMEYSSGARIFMGIIDIITMVAVPVLAIIGVVGGIATGGGAAVLSGLYLGLLATLFYAASGDAGRDFTYDDLLVRYSRVREQIIESLKVKDIDPRSAKEALNNLKAVDEVIAKAKPYTSIARSIANFIVPAHRRQKEAIDLQRTLEELSANDIFAQAAALRAA